MGCTISFEKKENNNQKGITWKLNMGLHSFLHATRLLYLIHIAVKLHEDMPKGYHVMGCTRIKIPHNKHKGRTSERKNGKQP